MPKKWNQLHSEDFSVRFTGLRTISLIHNYYFYRNILNTIYPMLNKNLKFLLVANLNQLGKQEEMYLPLVTPLPRGGRDEKSVLIKTVFIFVVLRQTQGVSFISFMFLLTIQELASYKTRRIFCHVFQNNAGASSYSYVRCSPAKFSDKQILNMFIFIFQHNRSYARDIVRSVLSLSSIAQVMQGTDLSISLITVSTSISPKDINL